MMATTHAHPRDKMMCGGPTGAPGEIGRRRSCDRLESPAGFRGGARRGARMVRHPPRAVVGRWGRGVSGRKEIMDPSLFHRPTLPYGVRLGIGACDAEETRYGSLVLDAQDRYPPRATIYAESVERGGRGASVRKEIIDPSLSHRPTQPYGLRLGIGTCDAEETRYGSLALPDAQNRLVFDVYGMRGVAGGCRRIRIIWRAFARRDRSGRCAARRGAGRQFRGKHGNSVVAETIVWFVLRCVPAPVRGHTLWRWRGCGAESSKIGSRG